MCIHKDSFKFPAAVNGGHRVNKSIHTRSRRTLLNMLARRRLAAEYPTTFLHLFCFANLINSIKNYLCNISKKTSPSGPE